MYILLVSFHVSNYPGMDDNDAPPSDNDYILPNNMTLDSYMGVGDGDGGDRRLVNNVFFLCPSGSFCFFYWLWCWR